MSINEPTEPISTDLPEILRKDHNLTAFKHPVMKKLLGKETPVELERFYEDFPEAWLILQSSKTLVQQGRKQSDENNEFYSFKHTTDEEGVNYWSYQAKANGKYVGYNIKVVGNSAQLNVFYRGDKMLGSNGRPFDSNIFAIEATLNSQTFKRVPETEYKVKSKNHADLSRDIEVLTKSRTDENIPKVTRRSRKI